MTRRDRTARLLETRLEWLAGVTERSLATARALDPRVLALEAATRHAIALGLVSAADAWAIWAGVARRHPNVTWCADGSRQVAAQAPEPGRVAAEPGTRAVAVSPRR